MIARIWQAWAEVSKADRYECFLRDTIIPALKAMDNGPHDMQINRRRDGDLVEFKTIMWFDDMAGVRAFAGDTFETAIVAEEDRALLVRFEQHVKHYEVVGSFAT